MQVVGAGDVVLVVLSVMPWLNVNLFLWSGSFSLLDLARMSDIARGLLEATGQMTGRAAEDFAMALGVVGWGLFAIWLIVAVLLVWNAWGNFTGKKEFACGGAVGICTLSVIMLALFALMDFAFVQEASHGELSGLIAGTPWAWGTLGLSVALLVYAGYQGRAPRGV